MRIRSLGYMPLLAALTATFMFSAAAAPSQAATGVVAASQAAPKAGQQLPREHDGIACRWVRSNIHNRAGHICVMVNFDDVDLGISAQALLNFKIKSGKLKSVCANHLNFWVSGHLRRSLSNACKKGGGQKNFISTKWWTLNPADHPLVQAGVYHPCIRWTDGGVACIKGWLKGPTVPTP